jgi:hypothetical protein
MNIPRSTPFFCLAILGALLLAQWDLRAEAAAYVPAPPGEALHAPRFLGKFWGQPLRVHDGNGGLLISVDFDEAYFVESVKEPMKKIHEGSTPGMVVAPLSDNEINALIAYVKSLSK